MRDPPGIDQITKAYTEEAVSIIRTAPRDRPFFLYLAHRSPHVPLEPASEFRGRCAGGLYGDVVEELDWSVGEVMKAVRERGTAERTTAVFFMSDNGPWLSQGEEAGSPGPFRAREEHALRRRRARARHRLVAGPLPGGACRRASRS